jgi:hypothetical protein
MKGLSNCSFCKPKSRLEEKVSNVLNSLNVFYIKENRFSDCKFKKPLPFDFYIPENNIAIECFGEQHYYPVDFGGKKDGSHLIDFEKRKFNDSIKEKYCLEHHIELLIIPYWEENNINEIIINKLGGKNGFFCYCY